jgi:surface polysaccharide O-acyltransferase-like enzyme
MVVGAGRAFGAGRDDRPGTPALAGASREASIDVLKACAIVTVVFIHACGTSFGMAAVPVEAFLTWWAVPAFFFASGFLHFRDTSISRALLRRWMRRLLVPYLVASVLALAVQVSWPGGLTLGQAPFALLTGSAWGIYYYVPVLAGALLAVPLLARAPRLAAPCFAVFWVTGLLTHMGLDPVTRTVGIFWTLRSPLNWWGYLLAGWIAARHRAAIHRTSPRGARCVGIAALAACAGIVVVHRSFAPWDVRIGGVMPYLTNYCLIGAIVALARDVRPGRLAMFLSENTYPIYLYHFFFTLAVRQRAAAIGPAVGAVALAAGVVGPLVILFIGRRLLGERARLLLG